MKKTTLFTLLLFNSFCCVFAQVDFQKETIVEESKNSDAPISINSADIDGDGDLDVIAALYGDGFAWFENIDGQGTFLNQHLIAEINTGARSIFPIDMDGDGDIDIVGGTNDLASPSRVIWYENLNGQGDFSTERIISVDVANVESVYAIDIDNDGDIDVLSTSLGDGKVSLYKNTGMENFAPQEVLATETRPASVKVADMDNDGDLDIVFCTDTNFSRIGWLENLDGQSNFANSVYIGAYTGDGFEEIDLKDINNDGNIDVITAYSNVISWIPNNGQGNFGFLTVIATNMSGASSAHGADIDSDGDIDVIGASENANKVVWYENLDGQGSFSTETVISSNSLEAIDVYASDIDNDGDMDVFSASFENDKISMFKNLDGLGTLDSEQIVAKNVDNPEIIRVADINGDSELDIIVHSQSDQEISWYPNTSNAIINFPIQRIIRSRGWVSASSAGASAIDLHTIDVDGDNDIDVVVAYSNQILWYENLNGLGDFSNARGISLNQFEIFDCIPFDIDNDSDMDFLFLSYTGQDIHLARNDGTGTFTQETLFTSNTILNQLVVGDVDNDNDLDLLFPSGVTARNLLWLENLDNQGTYSNSLQNLIQLNWTSFNRLVINGAYIEDVDGDLDDDVILLLENTANGYQNIELSWYENINGTLSTKQLMVDEEISFARFGDINGDGSLDVLVNRNLYWYENDGSNTFSVRNSLSNTGPITAADMRIGDLNNDGKLDVVRTWTSYGLDWFTNVGEIGNLISGNVSLDVNGNGCVNGLSISNVLITTDNGSNSFATFSQNNGSFEIAVNEGNFTTTIPSISLNDFIVSPASYTSNFAGQGNTDTANFCITPVNQINDAVVIVYPSINEPRPGFDTTYRIVYKNEGTTLLNGNVTFEFDNTKLQFLVSSETVTAQTTNTLTFNYTSLQPFEVRTIDLEFNVLPPPTTNIDDVLVSTATVNPTTGDSTQDNNLYVLEQLVIGSYDPNDISVLEGDEILIEDADEYLHYLIRFQNTGTASAINVVVENILDNNLDWTTIQLESLSHSGRVEITDGNRVEFIFEGINLPDSTSDEPNSHGFITYKIKPKNAVVGGDIIYNMADIFFDFNPPITTNTVSTEIVEPLSVDEFSNNNFSIYPNPTKDIIYVIGKEKIKKLSIVDLNGRLLNEIKYTNSQTTGEISMSHYAIGMYFLSIETDKGIYTHKIIKK